MDEKVYEIREHGRVLCSSPMENCGYSPALLKGMQKVGQFLYVNGKRVK